MRGGKREGAGRPKGAKNKRSLVSDQLKREIAQSGRDPVEYMLHVMEHDPDDNRRLEAAKGAAPYLRAKLSQANITHHDGDISAEEAKAKSEAGLSDPGVMGEFVNIVVSSSDLMEKAKKAFAERGLVIVPCDGPVTHISRAAS